MNLTIATTLANITVSEDARREARETLIRAATPVPDELVIKVHPRLEPVIDKLAKKKMGTWTFVATAVRQMNSEEAQLYASAFNVVEKDEELGSVAVGYQYRRNGKEQSIAIESKRIVKERGDQHIIKTGNPALAVRTALRFFVPTTLKEHMHEQIQAARNTFERVEARARNELNQTLFRVVPQTVLATYLSNNITDYKKFLSNNFPQGLDKLEGFDAELRSVEIAKSLSEASRRMTLWIKPNGEVVISDGADMVVYQSDELPASIKRKLGMLKLVEDTQIIEDVGMRLNNDVFIIMKGE